MNIGLIAPKVGFSTNIDALGEFWSHLTETAPYRNIWSGVSSALLTVAALTPSSYEIDFVDENFDVVDYSKDYDLVGISAMTQQALGGYRIADEFRKKNISVVIGGVHATVLPEEAKEHADSVVIGEAEHLWPVLLKDFEKEGLKPFYKSDRLVDLKDSPVPRFDLLNSENYHFIWPQTSRGCPHDCEYCTASKIFGPGYRMKGYDQVITELEFIRQHCGDKPIFFADDNFLVNKKSSEPLLNKMIDTKIRWQAQCDISIGENEAFLHLMRRSGCSLVFVGLESISEEGLRTIDKHRWKFRQLKNYSRNVQRIQSAGIGVMGAFMVGLDSDDSTTLDTLGDFIIDQNFYHASVTILTPVPGTRLRQRLEKQNRLLPTSWDSYTGYNVNYIPKKMTVEELERGLTKLYRRIYSQEVYLKKLAYFKETQKTLIKKGVT
jgi:radical SAM superfamily enzyme YgiQ (UPF0313 family)